MNVPIAKPIRVLSRKKRLVFRLLLLCIVAALTELLSGACLMLTRREFTLATLRRDQTEIASGSHVSDGATEAIHPYLGWIHNPQVSNSDAADSPHSRVNSLGFMDDGESVYKRSEDIYLIGIAGGSVAFQFSWEAENFLREKLNAHPRVAGRQIRIIRMALPGYKQPQQLMAYNYLLSLGAEFDLVLNMDGFNEAALTILENARQDTAIAYPRAWHGRSISMVDPRISADAARLLSLRGKRQQMAETVLQWPWRESRTANLVWYLRDQSLISELTDLGIQVSHHRQKSFVHHGPATTLSVEELEDEAAAIWYRCSLQMHHLCVGNGTEYLHVLQPNQYVPDSKPINPDEREKSYLEEGDTRPVIESLYPKLAAKGEQLAKSGVAFSDQRFVFANTIETLYVDPWCHFNETGSLILAEAVADEILRVLDRPKAEPSTPSAAGEKRPITVKSDAR